MDVYDINLLSEYHIVLAGGAGLATTTSQTPTSLSSAISLPAGSGKAVYILDGLLEIGLRSDLDTCTPTPKGNRKPSLGWPICWRFS